MQIEFLLMVLALPLFHLLGDFYLQTEKMAKGKSTDNYILLNHVMVYTYTCVIPIASMAWIMGLFTLPVFVVFVLVNLLAHYTTDYITSRYNKHFWETGNMKSFWRCIGVDQSIHWMTLMLTMVSCYYVSR